MMRSIIYFFITSILCVVVIELYIRGTEISGVSWTDYNKEIGRVIRPDANVVYYNENFTYSHINSYGYLGPSYSPGKQAGTFRIALLGDSYVEGFQVLERHHFRTILEENLKKELDYENIEILNFGRSGFGLEDNYAYDKNFVSNFKPDLKIYFLSAIDFYQGSGDELLPKWKLEENKLVQDTSYRSSTKAKVYNAVKIGLQHSVVLQMVRNCVNVVRDGKAGEVLLGKLNNIVQKKEEKVTDSQQENQIGHENLPEISKAILDKLKGSRNVIIVNKDTTQYPTLIKDVIARNGIRIVNLLDTLKNLKRRDIDPRYWPVTDTRGHWNYKGHKAVGEYLSRILSDRIGINVSRSKLGYTE